MFNISATELLVIAVVALLVLGPDKLPDAMRKLGRATKELKRITSGFEAELRDALSDPVETAGADLTPAPTPPRTPAESPPGAPPTCSPPTQRRYPSRRPPELRGSSRPGETAA